MNKKLIVAISAIASISGCKSTPDYRQITETELPSYQQKISTLASGKYRAYWVQPGNKQEDCKIQFEGYTFNGNPTQNDIMPENLHWDGECRNGKTHGLGKMSVDAGSIDWYEIAFHNEGITDQYFYSGAKGQPIVSYGAYVRENGRLTKRYEVHSTINEESQLDFTYNYLEVDQQLGTSKGIHLKKYNDGSSGKYTGVWGNTYFFGMREFFTTSNTPMWSGWGYVNMSNEKPESYSILRNQQGLWHQYYEYGSFVEYVQLPNSYATQINQVTSEASRTANAVSNAGRLALSMKEKYDSLHKPTAPKNVERQEHENDNPSVPSVISTGTGFFVSDDGYLLTNSHVIENAENIFISYEGESVPATLIDHDNNNDIALLKINKNVEALPIELKKKTKQGVEIAVLGYPNIGLQGNEQKATFGYINANSGIKGDTRYFQISSPIQPGNSGSPMVNDRGIVVGIASASLNQDAALKTTGTLAQNVNYAVKIAYALPMLVNHGVDYEESARTQSRTKPALIDSISASVVLIIAEQ